MKINKPQTMIDVEFSPSEIEILVNASDFLTDLIQQMTKENCDTLGGKCREKYSIEWLEEISVILDDLKDATQIWQRNKH